MKSVVITLIAILCTLSSLCKITNAFQQQGSLLSIGLPSNSIAGLHATKIKTDISSSAKTYGVDVPYQEASYDPHAAAKFYQNRRLDKISRLTQIVGKSSGFIAGTVLDSKLNREEKVSWLLSVAGTCCAYDSVLVHILCFLCTYALPTPLTASRSTFG